MVKFDLDFRIQVVSEYLNGCGSTSLIQKYGIKGESLLLQWVHSFELYGIKGLSLRRMNLEYSSQFKVDVINWKKQHNESLPVTALHFNLSSPSTVWQWERKFDAFGLAGLERKRGNPKTMVKHKKTTAHSSDNESTKEELKRLKQENTMLKIENEFLKKVDALVQKKSTHKKSQK